MLVFFRVSFSGKRRWPTFGEFESITGSPYIKPFILACMLLGLMTVAKCRID